jgi:hypothetical protein
MAETRYKTEVANIDFQKNPLKFCQAAYAEALKHADQYNDKVAKWRAFYNGFDEVLEDRRNDPNVKRSALFIHESRSAIDTRWSAIVDRLEEDDAPVRLVLPKEMATDENMRRAVDEKIVKLNAQMRPFFEDQLEEFFYGAEQQPLSFIKVFHGEKTGWIPKKREGSSESLTRRMAAAEPMPSDKTVYDYGEIDSSLHAEWCDWGEILYQPGVKKLNDMDYIIHVWKASHNELISLAQKYGYKEKAMRKLIASGGYDEAKDNTADQVRHKEHQPNPQSEIKEYLLYETYVSTFNSNGEEVIRVATVGNNDVILKNVPSQCRTIKYPFVDLRAFRRLGCFEGMCSVELIMDTQRAYSDMINVMFDAFSYGIFKPSLKKPTNKIHGEMRYSPGSIIDIDDPDGIKPLIDSILADIQVLPGMISMMEQKIRQLLNSPDVGQINYDIEGEEKATKTNLRFMSASRRQRPLFKIVRQAIIKIAEMFLKLNQENDPSWILPVKVEIPCLLGTFTPDQEAMKAMMVYEKALANPLYQTEKGLIYIRNFWVDALKKVRTSGIDEKVPSEKELIERINLMKILNDMIQTIMEQKGNGNGLDTLNRGPQIREGNQTGNKPPV